MNKQDRTCHYGVAEEIAVEIPGKHGPYCFVDFKIQSYKFVFLVFNIFSQEAFAESLFSSWE